MEKHEIKTLKILEAFHQNPAQTQRDLSRKLKISLGMVNAFIRRLIKKGYFKVSTISKKRIKYILTPKGLAEKSRLTYQYLLYSLGLYKETRAKMRSIFDLMSERGKKKVFFIGVSELTEIAIITLQESRLQLAGIIDSERVGEKLLGTIIMDTTPLGNLSPDDIVIVTKTDGGFDFSSIAHMQNGMTDIVDLSK